MMQNELASSHVLLFPLPLQGHVNCMLKLAELLAIAGIHVTFLNTDHIQNRLFGHSVDTHAALSSQNTRVRFMSIPDGLPDDSSLRASKLLQLEESLRTRAVISYKKLLFDLRSESGNSDGWPRLTCVVVDGAMAFAAEAADELRVPTMLFRTISACCTWTYLCIPQLLQNKELPFSPEMDLDGLIQGVPGMENFLRRRDISLFCRNAKDSSDPYLKFMSEVTAAAAKRERPFILNTIEELEASALSHIRSKCPITYTIGPLHALLHTYHGDDDKNKVNKHGKMSGSLLNEDRSCIDWLNLQPNRSVIYVSFGSLTVMSDTDFLEFWIGLVNSNQRFLWVVRSNLINEVESSASLLDAVSVTAELKEATKHRGLMVEWVPQEEVLAHPAVGCFFTHSGWNSTLESMVAGVPMLCWPFFADQHVNSRFVSEVWRIGLDMKDLSGREVVERMVREVMVGEKAEELQNSAIEMAKMVGMSVKEGGSSYVQFQKLIQHIRSFIAN